MKCYVKENSRLLGCDAVWSKMKAPQTFEMFGTTHQMTQHHISGTWIFINMIVTADPKWLKQNIYWKF
jgi:hypothetical protein